MRGILIVFLLLLLGGCGPASEDGVSVPKRVKVFEVGQQSAGQRRVISGRVVAAETSRLSFGVSGTLARLNVDPGDRFEIGQVLARLDDKPFQIAVEQARAQLATARAKLNESEQALKRIREIYAKGVSSQADVDSAVAIYESALGNLRAEQANLERKQRDLDLVSLTAPFDGQVTERGAESFEEVDASQTILTVQSEGTFEVQVGIPETLIRHIDYGQPVTVRFPSSDIETPAVVTEIGARSESGVAYPVSVRLADGNADLRAGMTASVRFELGRSGPAAAEVYLIPMSAIAVDLPLDDNIAQDGTYAPVLVVADGQLAARSIRIGDVRGNEVEVYEGLSEGDLVVSAGVPFLYEGMKVTIWSGKLADG